MHFLLTRPEEDNHRLAQILTKLGHRVSFSPLLDINYFAPQEIDLANFQALLFTSANAVRALIRNSPNRLIPCYAVGDATAAEATRAGFQAVFNAGGDVNKLAELVIRDLRPDAGRLLHVCGKDTAGNLSTMLERAGFHTSRKQLYKAVKATALSPKAHELMNCGQITHMPFYSPRTVQAFAQIIGTTNLTRITALCLSSAVSDVISCLDWHKILTAEEPNQRHLFNLISIILEENRP